MPLINVFIASYFALTGIIGKPWLELQCTPPTGSVVTSFYTVKRTALVKLETNQAISSSVQFSLRPRQTTRRRKAN